MDPEGTGAFQQETWRPQRERVGWLGDGEIGQDLFLDPDASFAAAQSMGRDTGDPLAVQPKTLHRRMQQAGLLQSVDAARHRLTVRRTLGGARRYVLHLSTSLLEGAAQTAQQARPGQAAAQGGPDPWAGPAEATLGTAHARTPRSAAIERAESRSGPDDGEASPVPLTDWGVIG